MDMDSYYIEPLLEDWLELIHKNTKEEIRAVREGKNNYIPYIGVPTPVVKVIFSIAECFNLEPNAKYLAVHIFDRFMCSVFLEILQLDREGHISSNSWSEINAKLSNQAKLNLLSCIQLASKLDSNIKSLTISQVHIVLRYIDPNNMYTSNDILLSEIKVFKTLNWTIPSYTPMNCIEVLLAASGLQNIPKIERTITYLLDVAYIKHDQLYTRFQILAQKRKHKIDREARMILEANSLFLAAAIILCSMFFLSANDKELLSIASDLAHITNILDEDIQDFAKLIFIIVME